MEQDTQEFRMTQNLQQGMAANHSIPEERQMLGSERDMTGAEAPRKNKLSKREIDVLNHVKEGFKNPEIAAVLNLSTKTVENHVRNILLKLGVKNRTQAVVTALRSSIIIF